MVLLIASVTPAFWASVAMTLAIFIPSVIVVLCVCLAIRSNERKSQQRSTGGRNFIEW